MGSLKPSDWPLILVHVLLLSLHPVDVQGIDSVSQKLRRLNEQFQQFQALTQARLDMLALNQNRNSSWDLESRVHTLQEHFHHMSQEVEQLKQSTRQEIEGLREWSRKLEKKSKRIEGRMALMERTLRESHRHFHEEKPDLGQDFSNLSQELQNQEERLAALQAQRDELLVGLNGLQESLKNQVLRVNRVEGQLGEVLHLNGGGNIRSSANSTSQEYYEPHRRGKTHRGGRPGKILGGYHQPTTGDISGTSQPEAKPYQHHASNQHLKAQKAGPQPDSHPQIQEQYTNPKPQSEDYLPLPDTDHPQSQIQLQAQTRPYPAKQEQLPFHRSVPYRHVQTQIKQPLHPHLHNPTHSAQPLPLPRVQTQPGKNGQSRTRLEPQSEPYQPRSSRWKGEKEEESVTKVKTAVIHDILQLPLRHKIPARPIPKKDASICNVDSMLVFPSASAENYVTFSSTLPVLPELSLCLWLRVENSHIGTLFSYATDENDNQLVLYGRSASSSSTSLFASSSSIYSSSPFSPSHHYSASSPSLDFVIGDPVFRSLSVSSFLDARWHHLCIVWSSIQGRFWHYIDRRLASSGSKFRKGWEIPGGGSVVLGQEQDSVGGGFDSAEGFAGQIAGFRLWNRVLSPFEVEGVAEGRGVPRGVVLDMEDIKEVHGEVQQVACECLEHCV